MGEPAPVGDRIVDALGDSKRRVDVLQDIDGGVGSGDATQARTIGKMSPPVGGPVLETSGERSGRFSGQRPTVLASPPRAFASPVGAAGAVERVEIGDVLG